MTKIQNNKPNLKTQNSFDHLYFEFVIYLEFGA